MNMTSLPLGQIARDYPGATGILKKMKLDFCCGGATTLKQAAREKGLDAHRIASDIEAHMSRRSGQPDPTDLSTESLIEHILERYHDIHREELPELIRLAKRVERVHGSHLKCPSGLADLLTDVLAELENHMAKEEQILFPMITRGINGMAVAPVAVMREEHDNHGAYLEKIESITNDMTLPEAACNTWKALYLGLETFRDDLTQHIHLENNVLFNRIDGRMGGVSNG
ncbi:iron-sulfur cluster repair di-iron protein [Marinobacter salinus]|uniref:Iron-sulfur cluster repair di-iron protein n=1 Tax=Marinobacter salinus TaxID=1874317 RepID=A0A1D9GGC7_9GAMM|nr:iron-sulfur cluster repair protein YtfE [Marinobacter salinus]AOY86706.1 iron-sulfur cluster repair di-iron protein [Marinobacter salinus]